MNKKGPVIVEFLGLPGSGKTYISKHLAAKLSDKGCNVVQPTYTIEKNYHEVFSSFIKIFKAFTFFSKHPLMSFKISKYISRTKQRTFRDFFVVTINFFYICELFNSFKQYNDVAIYDQGLFQALLAIKYSANKNILIEDEFLNLLESLIPERISVVAVETDSETFNQRLKARKGQKSRIERVVTNKEYSANKLFNKVFSDYLNILKFVEKINNRNKGKAIKIIKINNNINEDAGLDPKIDPIITKVLK